MTEFRKAIIILFTMLALLYIYDRLQPKCDENIEKIVETVFSTDKKEGWLESFGGVGIYMDKGNVVIVLEKRREGEKGLYVHPSSSSYKPPSHLQVGLYLKHSCQLGAKTGIHKNASYAHIYKYARSYILR